MCASAKISAAQRSPAAAAAAKKVHGHALSWKLKKRKKCVHSLALIEVCVIYEILQLDGNLFF